MGSCCRFTYRCLHLRCTSSLIKSRNQKTVLFSRTFSSEDDHGSTEPRIPRRFLKKLTKLNAGETKYEISFSEKSTPDASVIHEEKHSPEKVSELVRESVTLSDDSPPEFPSDIKSYDNRKRLQSTKAYRPVIDPSLTSIVLFQGQGSQFVGMGKELLPYPGVKDLFDKASSILGYDLLKICLKGPFEELRKTVFCQPAILVTSLAALIKLREIHPEVDDKCVGTAGFSVGELSALVFAEVLTFEDAVELVKVRAEAMQKASEETPSGMMTVFCGHDTKLNFALHAAKEYCRVKLHMENPVCSIANYLYPECKVVAGNMEALNFLEQNHRDFRIRRLKWLPVSGAFHTNLMDPAKAPFQAKLKRLELNKPRVPVYNNVNAARYRNAGSVIDLLPKQMCKPVKWEQTMHVLYARDQGRQFPKTYEIGPGGQLGVLLKKVNLKAGMHLVRMEV
ncbi:probable malonyl-CoA-acyl carrier protein transacylase, mitochondrial [Haliotis cracherodii]|uniref:probable malonyl-CoA-acyl carrier protein transacylase, mitochondrial n=1 Tax=Haliotis cracherodii TaxID=6455 RepID=UPI0039ED5EA8